MPRTSRSATIPAPVEDVWSVVGDPHHLPRWWPRVERVERVGPTGFTMVLGTRKGRKVRADYRLRRADLPRGQVWEQELEGSPFERLMRSSVTELEVSDGGADGARVRISIDQRMRGMSRFGGPLVRRATGRLLDEALAGLAASFGG